MKKLNKYKCTKCGVDFKIEHELDEDSRPVCTPCFKKGRDLAIKLAKQQAEWEVVERVLEARPNISKSWTLR